MRWLFSDFDGTITVSRKNIIKKNDKDFLKKWKEDGNKLVVASGKTVTEIVSVLKENEITFDYIIANNGAMIYDEDLNEIYSQNIPLEFREEILKELKILKSKVSIGYCIKSERKSFSHVFTKDIDENDYFKPYAPKKNNFELGAEDILNNKDLNIIQFFVNAIHLEELRNHLVNKLPKLSVHRIADNLIQINNKLSTKAFGVVYILELNKAQINENVIAVGNDINDLEMISLINESYSIKGNKLLDSKSKYKITNISDIK